MNAIWLVIPLIVISVLAGALFISQIKRPKLSVIEVGSGGDGPNFTRNEMSIANTPGILGISLGEILFFGRRILPPIRKGVSIDRNVATECRASLLEMPSKRQITMLWWQVGGRAVETVNLPTGGSANLMLFARRIDEPLKYFVYQPESPPLPSPTIPADDATWQDTREFLIRVTDSDGQRRLDASMTVRKGYDGRLSWEHNGGGGGL